MSTIKIKGKEYRYVIDYKENDALRDSFNKLTQKVFKFDFKEWYQSGYWKDQYVPYSIEIKEKIVSNVSVNIINFLVSGIERKFIQIGTVMTDPDYSELGLNKLLMEKVIEDWKDRCDLIYLFANDTVLDYYPKFGFVRGIEYQHFKLLNIKVDKSSYTKLDMSRKENIKFLFNKVNESAQFSKISMLNNPSNIMFYYTPTFLSQNVYYIKSLDAVVIAEFDKDILTLKDVFCNKKVDIDDVIEHLANTYTKKVFLGFTPEHTQNFDVTPIEEGDALFVFGNKIDVLNGKNEMRFPVLSHA